ncbi:hypothetical protein FOZ63_000809 [Perkinsus olseni]|uniref:Uncharacterized protein n=1 Tax=Perkinsus olseni TaxID=32597 RepID=A0A7J6SA97_PEROL|nr:hypothetical protein FOZ63_000809 [Perkinsus olseni]KAF4742848.1 hypothetical protein FOZ62_031812 [Perkinsus olseni]
MRILTLIQTLVQAAICAGSFLSRRMPTVVRKPAEREVEGQCMIRAESQGVAYFVVVEDTLRISEIFCKRHFKLLRPVTRNGVRSFEGHDSGDFIRAKGHNTDVLMEKLGVADDEELHRKMKKEADPQRKCKIGVNYINRKGREGGHFGGLYPNQPLLKFLCDEVKNMPTAANDVVVEDR